MQAAIFIGDPVKATADTLISLLSPAVFHQPRSILLGLLYKMLRSVCIIPAHHLDSVVQTLRHIRKIIRTVSRSVCPVPVIQPIAVIADHQTTCLQDPALAGICICQWVRTDGKHFILLPVKFLLRQHKIIRDLTHRYFRFRYRSHSGKCSLKHCRSGICPSAELRKRTAVCLQVICSICAVQLGQIHVRSPVSFYQKCRFHQRNSRIIPA